MSGKEIAECRKALGWSRMYLARKMKIPETTLRYMETGVFAVSPRYDFQWLRDLANVHRHISPKSGRSRSAE